MAAMTLAKRVGGDPVRRHIEAQRRHAARVVAHALQRKPEGRARDVDDDAVAERRAAEREVVERDRLRASRPRRAAGGSDEVEARNSR